MNKHTLLAVALINPVFALAQTYDLEHLGTGPVVGQDGWSGSSPIQVSVGSGLNTTKVLTSGVSGTPQIISRLNNANYSFPTLNSIETKVILQLDYRADNNLAELWFGVGVDLNGNGAIDNSSERGFGLGRYRNGVNLTRAGELNQLDGGLATIPAAYGDTVRLRLVADLTAFGGDGAGSLFYQNLSAGDVGFTLVYGGVRLNIRSEASHTPEQYNGLFLAVSSGIQSDNFTVVPEPFSTALLICGGSAAVGLFRSRNITAARRREATVA